MNKAEIIKSLKDFEEEDLRAISDAAWDVIKVKRDAAGSLKKLDFHEGCKVKMNTKDAYKFGEGTIIKINPKTAKVKFELKPGQTWKVPFSMLEVV